MMGFLSEKEPDSQHELSQGMAMILTDIYLLDHPWTRPLIHILVLMIEKTAV
jgi:hypothetical protein